MASFVGICHIEYDRGWLLLSAAPRGSQIQTEGEKDQQDHDQNAAFHG